MNIYYHCKLLLYGRSREFFIWKFWLIPWRNWPHPLSFFLIETPDPVATWKSNPLQTLWESTDASKFEINVIHSQTAGLTVQAQLNGLSLKNLKLCILDALHCVCTVYLCSEITELKWEGWIGQVERDWQNESLYDSIPFFKDRDVSGAVQLIISSMFVKVAQHQNYYCWTKA